MDEQATRGNLPYKVCEQIKDDGARCGAPALSGERLCRFHIRVSGDRPTPGDPGYTLPLLETVKSVQIALQEMMRAVIDGKLSERKAAIMLSGIKSAAALIRHSDLSTPKRDLLAEIASEVYARLPKASGAAELHDKKPAVSTGS